MSRGEEAETLAEKEVRRYINIISYVLFFVINLYQMF